MQSSNDDTTDETFLLLDYEQKQRFEGWATKLHACSYSDLYSLAIYIVLLLKGVWSHCNCLVQSDTDVILTSSKYIV